MTQIWLELRICNWSSSKLKLGDFSYSYSVLGRSINLSLNNNYPEFFKVITINVVFEKFRKTKQNIYLRNLKFYEYLTLFLKITESCTSFW